MVAYWLHFLCYRSLISDLTAKPHQPIQVLCFSSQGRIWEKRHLQRERAAFIVLEMALATLQTMKTIPGLVRFFDLYENHIRESLDLRVILMHTNRFLLDSCCKTEQQQFEFMPLLPHWVHMSMNSLLSRLFVPTDKTQTRLMEFTHLEMHVNEWCRFKNLHYTYHQKLIHYHSLEGGRLSHLSVIDR